MPNASSVPGLAVLEYAAAVGQSISARRWRQLGAVGVGLTALVAVVMGTWWLWYDMRGMAAIEHYDSTLVSEGVLRPCVIGAIGCIAWMARAVFRTASVAFLFPSQANRVFLVG